LAGKTKTKTKTKAKTNPKKKKRNRKRKTCEVVTGWVWLVADWGKKPRILQYIQFLQPLPSIPTSSAPTSLMFGLQLTNPTVLNPLQFSV